MTNPEPNEWLREYLRLHRGRNTANYTYRVKTSLLSFDHWLEKKQISIHSLTYDLLWEYYATLTEKSPYSRRNWRARVEHYLQWLCKSGYLTLDIKALCPRQFMRRHRWDLPELILPPTAVRFIELQKQRLKDSTVRSYGTSLRMFHTFLVQQKLDPQNIGRADIESFLRFIATAVDNHILSPSSRRHILGEVRTYLRWLYENELITHPPERLIYSKDFPKVPKRLPRPFPVEIDIEIQKRLAAKQSDPIAAGLILMRKTGIRVGELSQLQFSCLHQDSSGAPLLKVPLGKLNSERMVPLDSSAVAIIGNLQNLIRKRFPRKRPWSKTHLIARSDGQPTHTNEYRIYLQELTTDLAIRPLPTTHQMRHTYATSLLNAGMSLMALKEILGHKSLTMTLQYAAVTQETVKAEYLSAMEKIQTRYHPIATEDVEAKAEHISDERQLQQAMHELLQILKRTSLSKTGAAGKRRRRLLDRLYQIKHELKNS